MRSIGRKTVKWDDCVWSINYFMVPRYFKQSRLTKYCIDSKDFKKILDIIRKDLYLVVPQSGYLGFVGYDVLDLNAKLVLRFGKVNLPKGYYTSKRIFSSVVRSKQNIEIYNELKTKNCFFRLCMKSLKIMSINSFAPGFRGFFISISF